MEPLANVVLKLSDRPLFCACLLELFFPLPALLGPLYPERTELLPASPFLWLFSTVLLTLLRLVPEAELPREECPA